MNMMIMMEFDGNDDDDDNEEEEEYGASFTNFYQTSTWNLIFLALLNVCPL